MISRAAETQRFVLSANNAAPEQVCPTMIIAPNGQVLVEVVSDETATLRASLDLSLVSDWNLNQCRDDVIAIKLPNEQEHPQPDPGRTSPGESIMKTTRSHQPGTSGLKVVQRALIIIPIVVGLALALGFLGVSGSQAISPRPARITRVDAPRAVVTETLLVGIDVPYWPYEYYSGTQIIGHDITLMDAVATEISMTVVYSVVPWAGIFDGLIRGDYDAVISALTVTPERDELIDFALPYETYYSPGGSGNLAIAVQQGDTSLRTQINEALFSLRTDGTLAAIIAATSVDLAQAYSDTWAALPDWPEVPTDTETTLVYTNTQGSTTSIQVPSGAVSEAIVLEFTPLSTDTVTAGLSIAGQVFDLGAYQDGAYLPQGYQFNHPITITVQYTDTDVIGLDEGILLLQYWNETGGLWEDAACGPYDRHPDENWLAAPVCHLSRFALTGDEYHIYLPLTVKH